MRVFFVVMRPMPSEPCGGGGGVNYRIMKAQQKFHIFEDAYFIFSDQMIIDRTGEKLDLLPVDQLEYADKQRAVYSLLNKYFKFNKDDRFVFHDINSFCYMSEAVGDISGTIIVYNQQGGLYYDSLAYGAPENLDRKREFDRMTEYAIKHSTVFAFPSLGAREALIDTMPETDSWLSEKENVILYNGCTPELSDVANPDFEDIEDLLGTFNGNTFVSVAVLNEAKGVERLPAFFKEYDRSAGKNWLWVVIGNGAKAESLKEGIRGIESHVLWIRDYIPNECVLRIYRRADFYIMAHRFSIFDFATIEAMHMGCIPVLTEVGGNKEMLQYGNGYALDNKVSGKAFYEWERNADIDTLKMQNEMVAYEHFSELAMLERYSKVVNAGTLSYDVD